MPVQTRKIKPDEEGMRLDRWFKAHFPELSHSHLQKLLRTGQVRVDGGRAKTSTKLEPGMAVRVPPLTRTENANNLGTEASRVGTSARAPSKMGDAKSDAAFIKSITLYEDREVMVLNKPFGIAVQGGSGTTRHIDGMLEALRGKDGQKPRLVHRIDKDTCGRRRSRRRFVRARRVKSTGRWSRACRSRGRAGSRPILPKVPAKAAS